MNELRGLYESLLAHTYGISPTPIKRLEPDPVAPPPSWGDIVAQLTQEVQQNPLNVMPGYRPAGVGLGAGFGVKRSVGKRPLYHGTKLTRKDKILREGLREGKSSGVYRPGTSVSEDPLVSLQMFAEDMEPGNILRVKPHDAPSKWRNLRPSEYTMTPDIQTHADEVIRKPNWPFQEAETHLGRSGKRVPADIRPLTLEEEARISRQATEQEWVENYLAFTSNPSAKLLGHAAKISRGGRGVFNGNMYDIAMRFIHSDVIGNPRKVSQAKHLSERFTDQSDILASQETYLRTIRKEYDRLSPNERRKGGLDRILKKEMKEYDIQYRHLMKAREALYKYIMVTF